MFHILNDYRHIAFIFLFTLLFVFIKPVWGQTYDYFVDFEGDGETKGSYASGTVNLSGKDWDMTQALIGSTDSDWKNGERSARLRGYGTSSMTMLENKINGLGTISFKYRRFGTDPQVDWKVQYSTDNGSTWTQTGNDFTPPASDEVQTFSETVNIPGDVRIRIKRATETGTVDRRLNIDDISLTDHIPEELIPSAIIDFDDDNKWTAGSGPLTSYQTDHLYEDWNWLFTGGPALRQGTSIVDGYPGALGMYSWRLRDESGTQWTATYCSRGTIISFGFKVRRWRESPNPDWSVKYSTDGGASYSESLITINNDFLNNSSDWSTFVYILPEPLIVDCEEFVVKVSRNGGERIMIDDFAFGLGECENPDWHYKAVSSGNWNNACIWEHSEDGEDNWLPAYCVPECQAASIDIEEGNTVIVDKNLSVGPATIQNDAAIEIISGTLTVANGQENGLIINPGGMLHFNGGEIPVLEEGATVYVNSEGIVKVSANSAGFSNAVAGNGSSGSYVYETDAVFEWDVSLIFSTANQEYFPDANQQTIPVFRTTKNTGNVGATSDTKINGIFEANGNITWQNSGNKIFRNGITGQGNINQAESSGTFVINGNDAYLGGDGDIDLNVANMEISAPNTNLLSDKNITGTVIFNGSSIQSLIMAAPFEFQSLTVENNEGLLLNNDIIITDIFNMDGGDIDNEGFTVILGNSSSDPGTLIHSSGKIEGGFRRWIPSEIIYGVFFPIGKDGLYKPVTIDFTEAASSSGTVTAEFIDHIGDKEEFYGNLPFNDGGLVIDNLWEGGYWQLEDGDGLNVETYDITLEFDEPLISLVKEPDSLRIVKREDEFSDWFVAGEFDNASFEFITHKNVTTGFSEFAIGSNQSDNPLPVELLYFVAEEKGGNIELTWATASETNNDFFTLKRSTDMEGTEIIGYVQGAGNSIQTTCYGFTDTDPLPGINYYRLKQTDMDGSYEYSHWVAVDLSTSSSNLRIVFLYQREGNVSLGIEAPAGTKLQIKAADMHGRIVYNEPIVAGDSILEHNFMPRGFSGKMLVIHVSDQSSFITKKIIVK